MRALLGAAIIFAALTVWAIRHAVSALAIVQGKSAQFATIYMLAFLLLVWQTVLYSLERPKKVTSRQTDQLDRLKLVVPVPCYNEDPGLLKKCLVSLLNQTRKPDVIHMVDDGSNSPNADYTAVKAWFHGASIEAGVEAVWQRTENGGKRQAQGYAIRRWRGWADVYVTIDSDANLAPDAIEELIKPLADPKVQSVAGIVLAENNRGPKKPVKPVPKPSGGHAAPGRRAKRAGRGRVRALAKWRGQQLLCRMTDLWFVVGQLVDRSAMSTMGGVLVNSGVLAAYRADLVEDNLDGYLNETFFGRKVEFSDDSMLTIYALQRGKAVQQPTSYAFTAMPENLSHHLRQYLRWMRGAFIRSWWRFKYLPVNSYAYWGHLIGWIQMVLSTVVFGILFVYHPVLTHRILPELILIPVLVGYGQSLRYLSFRRSDEPFRSQLLTFALSPVAMLWSFFVLRIVRWYAMATCWTTLGKPNSWGTRQDGVEVSIDPTDAALQTV